MKNTQQTVFSFPVVYEEDPEGGYVVFVPALPGCHSQGETIEDATENIKEAIELYLESLEEHQEEIPQPKRIFQSNIEVTYPLSS